MEAMHERTPGGGTHRHRSSVQQLLIKAERLRLEEIAMDPDAKVDSETIGWLNRRRKGE
jgi:hypothetical protein